ncbi:hypothetical protein A2W45_01890 [Candidatus Curtissbacteria bacterium RIFCSPHIGHO2_12_41_11]|uniref:Protein kinase domain-containing protein n=3 Tax=Candidatus Curtissiibacteriota TaxID=1752717 RepID=A0A1F5HTQ0_9BACT|nr:MAG: hypothetical protein UU56_C0008G0058 [Candidatus Curtissbacteria bacterium GW2011_GWA2_41_24]OGD98177.1 MAG: hypothetical protein A2W45_01890 [Candidatus Curtissbacteria bacterium RIFCSPHIGHO2_12_41_11]OGE07389.1 MAG: hypothetical protein A2W70_03290 [Candidatus Curtissbacteria bacterium RIFCSPLOWO2_02_41_11]
MVESEIGLINRLPVGEGQKLEQLVAQRLGDYLTVFTPVRNKVLAVNGDVYTPFSLVEGKASTLGVFARCLVHDASGRISGCLNLETYEGHGRTAILGRVLFCDKQGRIYRDVDLKGIGSVGPWGVSGPGHIREDGRREGLLDEDSAFYEWQVSEELLFAGIRTPKVLAIIGLEELVVHRGLDRENWKLVEAIENNIIDFGFKPVILVRAFGVRSRIQDPYHYPFLDRLLVSDAKRMVEAEEAREFTNEEFLGWFGKTLGENVATMHNMGLKHGYLTPHNITLDCRIVDLDTVSPIELRIEREADYIEAADTMVWMGRYVDAGLARGEQSGILVCSFRQGYDEVFKGKEVPIK